MHYFIYSTADSWFTSGSKYAGVSSSNAQQNFGQDEILEVKKEFIDNSLQYQSRAVVNFKGTDLTNLSSSIADGTITNPTFKLRLYEAQGVSAISTDYKLAALAVSESWDEGIGKFGDSPATTIGCSWLNRSNTSTTDGSGETEWGTAGGSVYAESGSTQTFSYESPDVNMDISDMVKGWFSGSLETNAGLLLRFSGSQETDSTTTGKLKFFSRNTNTIYPPKLEVVWDDHVAALGDNTGSLGAIDVTGTQDNYVYVKGLRDRYKETEKVKFRIGARPSVIPKTVSTTYNDVTSSFIPEGSGSYSIIDASTGEVLVPFDTYSKLSCDVSGSYFNQWLNTFQPNRVYKILIKVLYNDKQEIIYDDNFDFKVVR